MGEIPRKDYNEAAVVNPANEVIKRVNTMNAPESFQASGLQFHPDKHIKINDENIESLARGTKVYDGNKAGYIKSVTTGGDPVAFVSAVFAYTKPGTGEEITETMTKQDFLNSTSMFLAKN